MKAPSIRRDNLNCMRPVGGGKENPALAFLEQLFENGILARQDWDALEPRDKLALKGHQNLDRFLMRLADHGLLTPYQSARLQSGQMNGLILGPYRLLDRLGAGTSSVVFKAQHMETRQDVALKVLIPGQKDDQLLVRFDTERRSIAQLQHPHIVRLLDVGETTSRDPDASLLYYYAMEFVQGTDLEAQVKQHGRFTVEEGCQLAFQMASALDCAHQHGLVHRDIKPSNILWTPDGESKLLDFGLARQQVNRLTQPGMVLGALEYIAPEQALDGSSVDIRADLFALGSTLYFCLTGQPPFSTKGDLLEVIQNRTRTPSPSVSILNNEVPAHLDALLARLMALNPAERYQTPRELLLALEEFVHVGSERIQGTHGVSRLGVESAAREGGRVLVVSAHPELAGGLEEAILAMDLVCQQIDDPARLTASLTRFDPDVVLIDMQLPVPALDLVKMVAAPGRFRKIVLLANDPSPRNAADYLAAGVDDLFLPDQEADSIRVRLRSLLQLQVAQRRMASANAEMLPASPEVVLPATTAKKKTGLLRWLWGGKSE